MGDRKRHWDQKVAEPLRIGRSEIRPFRDYVVTSMEQNGREKIGFNPGGSYERGKYPALDKALDQLGKSKELRDCKS